MVHNGVTMDAAETRVTVRLPADLAAALRERATVDNRSLNRQIVFVSSWAGRSGITMLSNSPSIPSKNQTLPFSIGPETVNRGSTLSSVQPFLL